MRYFVFLVCLALYDAPSFAAPSAPQKISYSVPKEPTGQLVYIRDQGRSGKWYKDEAGLNWYAKPDEVHAELQTAAEVISSEIYRELGYFAPRVVIREINGVRHAVISELPTDGVPSDNLADVHSAELRQMRFIAAYLKDWDRMQSENNFRYGTSDFAIFDFAGSLGSRAQGEFKPGTVVSEAIGAYDGSEDAAKIYNSFKPMGLPKNHAWMQVTRADAEVIVAKLKTLTDNKLIRIVAAAKYTQASDTRYMTEALRTRRDALIFHLVDCFK